jgi:hypothetical protein
MRRALPLHCVIGASVTSGALGLVCSLTWPLCGRQRPTPLPLCPPFGRRLRWCAWRPPNPQSGVLALCPVTRACAGRRDDGGCWRARAEAALRWSGRRRRAVRQGWQRAAISDAFIVLLCRSPHAACSFAVQVSCGFCLLLSCASLPVSLVSCWRGLRACLTGHLHSSLPIAPCAVGAPFHLLPPRSLGAAVASYVRAVQPCGQGALAVIWRSVVPGV